MGHPVYADFEAITEKVTGCQPNGTKSYTDKYQKHTGCSYEKLCAAMMIHIQNQLKFYRGEDSINKFMQQMLLEVQHCHKIISTKFKKPLQMTDEDKQQFKATEECHICGQQYKRTSDITVGDHCHVTGQL